MFDFEPQAHWDLGPSWASSISSGRRGVGRAVLVPDGRRRPLSRALINFMLELHTREHGYTEVEPPFLVNAAALTGTGNLPKFEADLFKIAATGICTSADRRVPLTSPPHGNSRRPAAAAEVPRYTPCFRSEAGSYGADVRGLIRQHQFDKVEMVKFAAPGPVHDELERMWHGEEVLVRLGLPFRTSDALHRRHGVRVGHDLRHRGLAAEPEDVSRDFVLHEHEAFQARRANIKFRPDGTGKAEFVHTLNGSGLAVGRTLVAILENYQEKDGIVDHPGGAAAVHGREGQNRRQKIGDRRRDATILGSCELRILRILAGRAMHSDVRPGNFARSLVRTIAGSFFCLLLASVFCSSSVPRRGGRVVDGSGLENRRTGNRYRGFESLPLRQESRKSPALVCHLPGSDRRNLRFFSHLCPRGSAGTRSPSNGTQRLKKEAEESQRFPRSRSLKLLRHLERLRRMKSRLSATSA